MRTTGGHYASWRMQRGYCKIGKKVRRLKNENYGDAVHSKNVNLKTEKRKEYIYSNEYRSVYTSIHRNISYVILHLMLRNLCRLDRA
jgi:hypothetical protein